MDAGKLNTRIKILDYRLVDGVWQWVESGDGAWAKVDWREYVSYSNHASDNSGAKFTIRRQPLTKDKALKLGEQHYTIARVEDLPTNRYLYITATETTPVICEAYNPQMVYDELNRPVYGIPETIKFYGIVSVFKKFALSGDASLKWSQERPYAELKDTFVVTTPKQIDLRSGQTVRVDGEVYAVTRVFKNETHMNDYEITVKEDA